TEGAGPRRDRLPFSSRPPTQGGRLFLEDPAPVDQGPTNRRSRPPRFVGSSGYCHVPQGREPHSNLFLIFCNHLPLWNPLVPIWVGGLVDRVGGRVRGRVVSRDQGGRAGSGPEMERGSPSI